MTTTARPGAHTVVANRYLLERELGSGATGTVWLARDLLLDSACAVKLVHSASDGDLRASFLREAMAAARIRCANVVTIFDYGEWQGLPYIAMENLEGETLDTRLARVQRLEPRQTYELIVHVARGLVRAHSLGIVHRDLKPANIFVSSGDDHEVYKVLDFGIAKQEACAVPAFPADYGEGVGTPYYVSPEQARAATLDHRADLWSFAAIICECLTGQPPFVADSIAEVLQLAAHGPVPRLSERRVGLPRALDAWLDRALARDPAGRFETAKELADAFADACGLPRQPVPSLSPRASIGSLPEIEQAASITLTTARFARPSRGRPLLLALGAALALGALAALWLVRASADDPRAPAASLSPASTRGPSAQPLAGASAPPAPAPSSGVAAKKKSLSAPAPSPSAKPARTRQRWRYDPGF